jgi:UDP-glucose 4-epimerase
MKILLTGATGFLGKNLLPILLKKHKVLVITKNLKLKNNLNQKIIYSKIENLNDYNLGKIKKFKPEVLINLSWHGIPDFSYKNSIKNLKDQTFFINKIIDLNVLKKVISTGSCLEYPENFGKCHEKIKISPTSYFTWSKNSLMNFIKFKCKNKKINFVWFRIFYMYGNYQRKGSLIPTIIKSLQNLKKPVLSAPLNLNDYIHVHDVCNAIIKSMENKLTSGIFNIGSGKLTSVLDIYKKILNLMELNKVKKFAIKTQKQKQKQNKTNFACLDKIQKNLKWKPMIDFDNSLKHLIDFK